MRRSPESRDGGWEEAEKPFAARLPFLPSHLGLFSSTETPPSHLPLSGTSIPLHPSHAANCHSTPTRLNHLSSPLSTSFRPPPAGRAMRDDPPSRPPSSTPRPQPVRPRTALSPTPSYTQAAGTSRLTRERSHTAPGADASARFNPYVLAGSKRVVYCDVVIDADRSEGEGGDYELPRSVQKFLVENSDRVAQPTRGVARKHPPRARTPGPPPKVDLNKAARSLRELFTTESSYLRKIKALYRDFALPLRQYAKNPSTAIIKPYDALQLFSNIEQIVPITEAFVDDLQDLVAELDSNPSQIPPRLGQVMLKNVQQMAPYKTWLSKVSHAQALYQRLHSSNAAFNSFIDATLVHSREQASYSGGFSEFLSEPFQRPGRYGLMLDVIRLSLRQTDESVPYLVEAGQLLSEICSMEVDEDTQRAAALWALNRTITSFPAEMTAHRRVFITCLDVDEFLDPFSSPLRCTLFLFTDTILIAKRPKGDAGGLQLTGLDDIDKLALLSQAELAGSNPPGTPRKNKKDSMGFRGAVEIDEVYAVDFGGVDFGLVFSRPPFNERSERWEGRPARKYTVASTYATDTRRAEKDAFLEQLADLRCLFFENQGHGMARKTVRPLEADGPHDSLAVYWNVGESGWWENDDARGKKGKLALQLGGPSGEAPDLALDAHRAPVVVARADFVNEEECRVSVRSMDRPSRTASERIASDHIPLSVDTIASSYSLYSFPIGTPRSPGGSGRSRPRSFVSSALDVFGGGSSLKRMESTTSKASTATTTSYLSGHSFHSFSPRVQGPNKLQRNSGSPSWYGAHGSKSAVEVGSHRMEYSGASETEDEEDDLEVLSKPFRANSESPGTFLALPDPRSRRRSTSLPPPPPANLYVPSPPPPRVSRVPVPPVEPLPEETPPLARQYTVSRRLMGPRQLGEAPRSVSVSRSQSPAPHPYIEPADDEPPPPPSRGPSPSPSPFARDHSPTPTIPFAQDHSPTPPTPLRRAPTRPSTPPKAPSPSGPKRALAECASPRASPAKKMASLSEGGPRRPSPTLARTGGGPAPRAPAGGQRNFSGGAARRKGRVASGASAATVRAASSQAPVVASGGWTAGDREMEVEKEQQQETRSKIPYTLGPIPPPSFSPTPPAPFSQAREHLLDLRNNLSQQQASSAVLRQKENAPSPAGLSRSPNTRNIYLKANGINSVLSSDPPKDAKPLDAGAMLRWADRLETLLDAGDAQFRSQGSPMQEDVGPHEAEFLTLAIERDLFADELEDARAQLAAKDAELEKMNAERAKLLSLLSATQRQNSMLREMYTEITGSVKQGYSDYSHELGLVSDLVKETAPPDAQYLVDALQWALLEKNTAVLDLAQIKRDQAFVIEEKDVQIAQLQQKIRGG